MSDFVDQKIPKYRDRAPVLPSPNLTRISIPVSFVSTAAASNEPVGQQRTVYEIPIHRARSTNDINEPPMQWIQNEFPRFQPMFQQQQQPNPQYQQQQQPNPQYQQQQSQPQQYQQQSQPQQYQQQSQPQQYQQQSQPQQYQQQRQPNRFYPYDFDMMNPQPDFVDPTMFQHQQFYAPPFNQQDNWNRQMFEPPNNQFYQQRYFPSGMRQAHSQETVFDNVPMRDRWRQSTPQPAQNEFVRQSKSPSPPNVADLDKPIPMAYAPLKPLQKSDRVSSDSQILNNRTTKTSSGQNEEMKFALILNGIDAELNALQAELAKFKGTRGDQQHIYLEEMLTKCLIGCDSVVSDEVSDGIRMRRKQVVKKCQSLAEELDKKVKEKKPEIVVTNTAETENEIQNAKKVRGRVKASGGENEKTRRISENPIPMSYTHVVKSDDGKKEETPPPTNEQPTTDKSPAAEHLEMLEKIDATIDCLAQRLTKVKLNENEKLEIDERITKCILDCDNITGANLETEVRRKRKDVIKKAQGLLDRKE